MISTLVLGPLSDKFGRFNLLMISEILMIGVCIWYCYPNIYSFYGARFGAGMVAAMSQALSPVVLTEMFPQEIAAKMGMVVYISLTGMICVAYMVNYIFDSPEAIAANYRIIFSWIGVISIVRLILLIAFFIGKETPSFLVSSSGDIDDERSASRTRLCSILSTVYAKEEVDTIAEDLIR